VTRGVDAQLDAQLAADLATTRRRAGELDVSTAEKSLASKRLLAINDASKHDVATASRRHQACVRDVDEGRIQVPEDGDEA
jgi:hypothetical protein